MYTDTSGPDNPLLYISLNENSFKQNFKLIFGVDCQFFGKILYLYMARGYDKAIISFGRFLECLYPLYNNDNRFNHNKIAFKILDIDRDNGLNALNLLHLQMNLSPKSILGQEVFKLMEYYIKNYLSKKNASLNKRENINYDIFSKILPQSCLIKEIR